MIHCIWASYLHYGLTAYHLKQFAFTFWVTSWRNDQKNSRQSHNDNYGEVNRCLRLFALFLNPGYVLKDVLHL